MKDSANKQFKELAWRQQLTDVERARIEKHLAEHPETRADWEADLSLNRLLQQLPEAPPVASNFTAQVMQAVERQGWPQPEKIAGRQGWLDWRVWVPRLSVACAVLGVGCLALFQQHQIAERRMTGQIVAKMAEAYSAAGPTTVQDFDSISRLGTGGSATPDTQLIALMK